MKTLALLVITLILSIGKGVAQSELESLNQKLHRAEQTGNSDSLATVYHDLAQYYSFINVDSMYIYTQEGLKYANKNKVEPYIGLLNNYMVYYSAIGKGKESIQAGLYAVSEMQRLNLDDYTLGNLYSSLGVCYRRTNQPDSALNYYNKALTHLEKAGEQAYDDVPFLLTNIAVLYANSSRIEEADAYIHKAIDKLDNAEDIDTYFYVSNSAGAIFTIQEKYQEAEELLLKIQRKVKAENKVRMVILNASQLINLYNRTENTKAVDKCVADLKPWIQQVPPNTTELMGYYESIAQFYTSRKRYQESNKYFKIILENIDNDSQTPLPLLYLKIAQNYRGMNNLKESTKYYELSIAASDSIYNTEIDKQLSEFSMKFENQEKQLEIARLNEESLMQKNRSLLWIIFAAFLCVVCITLVVYGIEKRKKLKHEGKIKSIQSFISGLEQERARLGKELHDGVCNDIYSIAMMLQYGENDQQSKQEILKGLEMIRSDVRAISHELTPPQFQNVAINEVFENFIQHLHLPLSMHITFHQENMEEDWNNVPETICYNMYRILQELMGNIIHHSQATNVDVELAVKPGTICMTITNNGRSFDLHTNNSNGIGLNTISDRVQLINATFTKEIKDGKQFFKIESTWV